MLGDGLAFNPQALNGLRAQAARDGGKESMRAAAQQFESYFLQLMLRSMRETVQQDGMFDSSETRMFTEMFDQQVAQSIAKSKGVGLADMLVEQIQAAQEAGSVVKPSPRSYDLPSLLPEEKQAKIAPLNQVGNGLEPLTPKNFVNKLWPHAADAGRQLGVSPHFLLAQAALETGWGKSELKTPDGGNSFNLFNIKAGNGWQGRRVESQTTEYYNGKASTQTAQFRAYDSYAEAFSDYASLLKNNPRYADVVGTGGDAEKFARGLQQGGYATDPTYADKILRVMNSRAFREELLAPAA